MARVDVGVDEGGVGVRGGNETLAGDELAVVRDSLAELLVLGGGGDQAGDDLGAGATTLLLVGGERRLLRAHPRLDVWEGGRVDALVVDGRTARGAAGAGLTAAGFGGEVGVGVDAAVASAGASAGAVAPAPTRGGGVVVAAGGGVGRSAADPGGGVIAVLGRLETLGVPLAEGTLARGAVSRLLTLTLARNLSVARSLAAAAARAIRVGRREFSLNPRTLLALAHADGGSSDASEECDVARRTRGGATVPPRTPGGGDTAERGHELVSGTAPSRRTLARAARRSFRRAKIGAQGADTSAARYKSLANPSAGTSRALGRSVVRASRNRRSRPAPSLPFTARVVVASRATRPGTSRVPVPSSRNDPSKMSALSLASPSVGNVAALRRAAPRARTVRAAVRCSAADKVRRRPRPRSRAHSRAAGFPHLLRPPDSATRHAGRNPGAPVLTSRSPRSRTCRTPPPPPRSPAAVSAPLLWPPASLSPPLRPPLPR